MVYTSDLLNVNPEIFLPEDRYVKLYTAKVFEIGN